MSKFGNFRANLVEFRGWKRSFPVSDHTGTIRHSSVNEGKSRFRAIS